MHHFEPPRRRGLLAHLGLLAGCLGASATFFSLATRSALGLGFVLLLLGALACALPLPLVGYRLAALMRGGYEVSRDGLRLHWGWRAEDIPIHAILWAELAEDLVQPLTLPRLRWPGALVGSTRHPDAGEVEFMAAEAESLIVVGTAERTYAISPADPAAFLRTYQIELERGSLAPLKPWSARPDFLLADVWQIPLARGFLLTLILLNLLLFVWVGLAVPGLETVSLGYTPSGALENPVPAAQLFLLPVVNLGLGLASLLVASAYHRQRADHPLAYALWGVASLSSLLFVVVVYVILFNA